MKRSGVDWSSQSKLVTPVDALNWPVPVRLFPVLERRLVKLGPCCRFLYKISLEQPRCLFQSLFDLTIIADSPDIDMTVSSIPVHSFLALIEKYIRSERYSICWSLRPAEPSMQSI